MLTGGVFCIRGGYEAFKLATCTTRAPFNRYLGEVSTLLAGLLSTWTILGFGRLTSFSVVVGLSQPDALMAKLFSIPSSAPGRLSPPRKPDGCAAASSSIHSTSIRRYEAETGAAVILADSGETFEKVAARRRNDERD